MIINKREIWSQMKDSLQLYSEEVNENRALPAIEDGLKPSGRQLLYCLYKNKFFSNKPYTKSANAIGLTMASYYPHGDAPLGDVLSNLSMAWKHNAPLIDFHGGLGSVDNPTATAAPRYTECRLSRYAEQLIGDLKNELSEEMWEDNYLQTEQIPKRFPGNFPNLLINENLGIGWACAGSWLPHNLSDITQLIEYYSNTQTLSEIFPSFPGGGGIIINGGDLPMIYKTGKGTIYLKAKYQINNNTFTITELPYRVGPKKILQQIEEAKENNAAWALNIVEAYDNSTMGKTELIITQRKLDEESLLKATLLATTFSVNMTALVNGKPKLVNLEYIVQYYLERQHSRILQKALKLKEIAKFKKHELEGFITILPALDQAIKIIKQSNSKVEASIALCAEFNITSEQAAAILGLKLSQLTQKGISEVQEEIEI